MHDSWNNLYIYVFPQGMKAASDDDDDDDDDDDMVFFCVTSICRICNEITFFPIPAINGIVVSF